LASAHTRCVKSNTIKGLTLANNNKKKTINIKFGGDQESPIVSVRTYACTLNDFTLEPILEETSSFVFDNSTPSS
jgi:hypothetical protein